MHREISRFRRQPVTLHREAVAYQRQPDPARRHATRYQPQTGPGWQEATDRRHEVSSPGSDPGLSTGFQDDFQDEGNSLWMAGQLLTLADDQAAQITHEAHDDAAAIRQAAQREAAALTEQANAQAAVIREAAEREAAELRTRIDALVGELNRMAAAYLTDGLSTPPPMSAAVPAIQAPPAVPAAAPTLPGAGTAPPGTRSARPATRQTGPGTGETELRARPTGPTRPTTSSAKGPQNRPRQHGAMRLTAYATATAVLCALVAGAAETGLHGYKFFLFREGGIGQTATTETDQQFLARQAAATHHVLAPKGRHHKKPHQKVVVHIKASPPG